MTDLEARLLSGILFVALPVGALGANIGLKVLVKRFTFRRPDALSTRLLVDLRVPVVLLVGLTGTLLGFWIAVTKIEYRVFDFVENLGIFGGRASLIAIIAVISYVVATLLKALLTWYVTRQAASSGAIAHDRLVQTVRRVAPFIVYTLATLLGLDAVGVSISPLLASLGIGGVAMAVALTPTLTGFIAGTYVLSEGNLKEGDYLELLTGPTGTVLKVGARSTTLRDRFGNLLIVPNGLLAETIITNHSGPTPILTGIVECGVSSDADLEEVEEICSDIVREIIEESEYAVKEFEPVFRFTEFAGKNVNFRIIFQAYNHTGSIQMKSEIIKRFHTWFKEEEEFDIDVNARKVLTPRSNETMPVLPSY